MIVKDFTTRLKLTLLAMLSLVVLAVPKAHSQDKSSPAVATEAPAVTLAIAGFDKLVPDVKYLVSAAGFQQQAGIFTFLVNQYTQGLDKSRAIGVTVDLPPGGLQPRVFVMLPIKDLDTFFAANANSLSKNEVGPNVYELTLNTSQQFFAVYDKSWLFVTQEKNDLDLHPKSPNLLTDPLTARYTVGLNLNLKSVPEDAKKEIIANLEQGFKSGFNQNSNLSAEDAENARKQGELMLEHVKELINDTDQLMLGIAVDQRAKFLALDFASKFDPSSKIASQVNALAGLKSSLGALAQDSDPIQVTYRSKLTTEEIDQMNAGLDTQLKQLNSNIKKSIDNPKGREVVGRIATVLAESLKSTLADGEIDSAYGLNFVNGINLVSFSKVANSSELEGKLIGLLREYQSEPMAPKLSSQAVDYSGMKLYSGTWKVPDDKDLEDIRKIVGETIPFTFAFGKNNAGFAAGVNSEANVKSAIDRIQKAQPAAANPFNMSIELLPILQYVAPLVKGPKETYILQATIAKVSEFESNDKLKVESRVAKDGFIIRTTLEEGILQAIGSAVVTSSGPPPGPRK